MNRFLWWKCLDCLDWERIVLVFRVWTQHVNVHHLLNWRGQRCFGVVESVDTTRKWYNIFSIRGAKSVSVMPFVSFTFCEIEWKKLIHFRNCQNAFFNYIPLFVDLHWSLHCSGGSASFFLERIFSFFSLRKIIWEIFENLFF
jgi:hypothetical protein